MGQQPLSLGNMEAPQQAISSSGVKPVIESSRSGFRSFHATARCSKRHAVHWRSWSPIYNVYSVHCGAVARGACLDGKPWITGAQAWLATRSNLAFIREFICLVEFTSGYP